MAAPFELPPTQTNLEIPPARPLVGRVSTDMLRGGREEADEDGEIVLGWNE